MSIHSFFFFGKPAKLAINQSILKLLTASYFDQTLQIQLYVIRKVLGCIHFTDI